MSKQRSTKNPQLDALMEAILNDDRDAARALVKSDSTLVSATINQACLYQSKIFHWLYVGDTALHLAAAGYRVEIARALLAAGADPNSRMNHRRSGPLHYAADGYVVTSAWDPKRQVKMIRCLVEAGADINAQDKNGAAPLHRAVRTRCAAAVRVLLDLGSDATLRNNPGSTPFHLAVQNTGRGGSGAEVAREAQRQIIEEFLSFGISTSVKDATGKSVLDWARNDSIRNLLQRE